MNVSKLALSLPLLVSLLASGCIVEDEYSPNGGEQQDITGLPSGNNFGSFTLANKEGFPSKVSDEFKCLETNCDLGATFEILAGPDANGGVPMAGTSALTVRMIGPHPSTTEVVETLVFGSDSSFTDLTFGVSTTGWNLSLPGIEEGTYTVSVELAELDAATAIWRIRAPASPITE